MSWKSGVAVIILLLLILKMTRNTAPIGAAIDSLNGVKVYYNGRIGNVSSRSLSADQYNFGLKYQCVEFVKRYYYEHLRHKMPDTYGHAKDFFISNLPDGAFNEQRALAQYRNPSQSKPQVNDLLVYSPTLFNPYGHVAIVSAVQPNSMEIIQQNPGIWGNPRQRYQLVEEAGRWRIKKQRILGWLRKR